MTSSSQYESLLLFFPAPYSFYSASIGIVCIFYDREKLGYVGSKVYSLFCTKKAVPEMQLCLPPERLIKIRAVETLVL